MVCEEFALEKRHIEVHPGLAQKIANMRHDNRFSLSNRGQETMSTAPVASGIRHLQFRQCADTTTWEQIRSSGRGSKGGS